MLHRPYARRLIVIGDLDKFMKVAPERTGGKRDAPKREPRAATISKLETNFTNDAIICGFLRLLDHTGALIGQGLVYRPYMVPRRVSWDQLDGFDRDTAKLRDLAAASQATAKC